MAARQKLALGLALLLVVGLIGHCCAQAIYGLTSSHDKSQWFTYRGQVGSFGGASKSADLVINDGQVFQQMSGFGAAITDSTSISLQNLKSQSAGAYWAAMNQLFNMSDGSGAALSHARVPISSCDFSVSWYSYDDTQNNAPDPNLSHFNINNAPWQLWATLRDAVSINPGLKIMFTPWTQPAWMKSPQKMNGGVVNPQYYSAYASYFVRTMQAIAQMGFRKNMWAVSVQNEPYYQPNDYPGTFMDAPMQAAIGKYIRPALDQAGFKDIIMLALDHNWNLDTYPVEVFQKAPGMFQGVGWHCYGGQPSQQQTFNQAYPNAEVHFTECTRLTGSGEPWSNLRANAQQLLIESINYGSQSVTIWNAALDFNSGNGDTSPHLPNVCPNCIAPVLIEGPHYSLSSDWAMLAQGSVAVKPADPNGPFGKRIGSQSNNPNLILTAFKTERAQGSSQPTRYSAVVLNWDDNYERGPFITIDAVIQFQGKQATVSLPVGVTTLYWFA